MITCSLWRIHPTSMSDCLFDSFQFVFVWFSEQLYLTQFAIPLRCLRLCLSNALRLMYSLYMLSKMFYDCMRCNIYFH
jgi:hypothetical protein